MKDQAINGQIRHKMITLILDDGSKFGDVATKEALSIANEKGLDLVEVSGPDKNNFAICKILDYGKLKYKQSKKDRHQPKSVSAKEMRISSVISEHDLLVKNCKVEKFLKSGHRVKYVLFVKGRQRKFFESMREKFDQAISCFSEYSHQGEIKIGENSIAVWLTPK